MEQKKNLSTLFTAVIQEFTESCYLICTSSWICVSLPALLSSVQVQLLPLMRTVILAPPTPLQLYHD